MTKLELASIENLSLGYIVTSVDHDVLFINRAAREILALTKLTKTLEEVVDRLPKRLAILDHVKYCSIEHKSCSFKEVDLGDRKIKVFLSPIFDGYELAGNVLTLEDITETVEREKARDQFLSILVHELRTPLTAIRGTSKIIEDYYKEALKDVELAELVETIDNSSYHLLQMISHFLDMSRLEEGRIDFDLKEFEISKVIKESVESLDVIAKDRNIKLELKIDKNFKQEVVADPNIVKQVLTNLIGNALKFTESGSVTVDASKISDQVEISVTDTGPGIPKESQQNLFQKYFQASNNKLKGDSSKSTGLGLYITRLMVEGMGCRIYLRESGLGKGSTFAFTLDIATPDRLKRLKKELYDKKQGVKHTEDPDHSVV